jgi:hypothetical protein
VITKNEIEVKILAQKAWNKLLKKIKIIFVLNPE